MVRKSISVVVPNYNGQHLLQQNLPSVISALENANTSYEIILVDDCSRDNSIEFIRTVYPQIQVIESTVNGGFSITCNKGIAAAQKELIFLLNTDIELTANYFEGLFHYFDRADTFGVMGKIIGRDGVTQDTARLYTRRGFTIKANTFFYIDDAAFWTPTAYLSGANALVDAKKLKALGGFDAIYSPFYYEDFDLGLRAWRMGWKCYYEHQTHCIHETSSTTKNYKTRNWVKGIFFRNKIIMHSVHLGRTARYLYYVQITASLLFMWLGLKFFYYTAFYKFLLQLKNVRRSRKKLWEMPEPRSVMTIDDVANTMGTMLEDAKLIYR